ncbi:geranylgeranylglyceryl/heptaprenylglyceryl phosphate synthase [Bacteroidota bacterium]
MNWIEKHINEAIQQGKKLFAWLIDPDKLSLDMLIDQLKIASQFPPDLIFLGGSLMIKDQINEFILQIRSHLDRPIILFPGSTNQINENADGILFLSLISGRNPDFLIGRHVESAYLLKKSKLQVLPTGYMLIDSGKPTTASYISNTFPIPHNKPDIALSTAIAGELLGLRFIFLDGGSGAQSTVSMEMIQLVKENINIPLITGGGIKNPEQMKSAFDAGADIVVVGNVIETNPDLLQGFYHITNS